MLSSGSSGIDISPAKSVFLAGYPHVPRMSEGINDPLLASAIFLDNGERQIVIISLDLLFIGIDFARKMRKRTARALKISEACVFISCTHTHSGPLTADFLAFKSDPVVPAVDECYLDFILEKTVAAALQAKQNACDAEFAFEAVDVAGVGCNRHDPDSERDPEAGILALRSINDRKIFALALIYSMHPTVLHEDSRLISGDFPAFARMHLQQKLGSDLTVCYHTAPAGDQSPRYHVKGQTFSEAKRLGGILGEAVMNKITRLEPGCFKKNIKLNGIIKQVSLPPRTMVPVKNAQRLLNERVKEFAALKNSGAPHARQRTAECAVFGAEENLFLAQCSENGTLEKYLQKYTPCDIQCLRIGKLCLAGLPGEIFVKYALKIKHDSGVKTFVVSLVNGELQGYIVTPAAAGTNCYEAANSIFAPESGAILVENTMQATRELFL